MFKQIHVMFMPLDSYGHINSCIGIAEKLVHHFGHRVTFALESAWKDTVKKRYGFDEVLYTDPSRESNLGPNEHWIKSVELIADCLQEDSLYKAMHQNIKEFEEFAFNELHYDDQLKDIIANMNPDIIVLDTYFTAPAIFNSGRKWIFMTSATPLSAIPDENTPPSGSGYPTNGDRKQWKIFNEAGEKHFGVVIEQFGKKLMELGLPALPPGRSFHPSPYLNIYAYPEDLDYLDVRPLPDKWKRFDHFIRTMDNHQGKFVIPEKLKNLPGKFVYVSMGSMGCVHLKLMKRLVEMLANSPHRFLMVLGPSYGKIELPENIWAEKMVPQIEVLPQVDLVITHGGNNTVLESLYFGKPMIINPLFYDQYDNAQRVTEKGFGHRINAYTCQPEEFAKLIETALTDERMHDRCKKVSEKMKSSNSCREAAKAIIDIAIGEK